MKKTILFVLCVALMLTSINVLGSENNVFVDVNKDDWYYTSVTELYNNNILPGSKEFNGDIAASRGDIIEYMYNLYKCLNGEWTKSDKVIFDDVGNDSKYFEAVDWAYKNGIVNGIKKNEFCPDAQCSREQVCVMAIRYFNAFNIKPKQLCEADQFVDSLKIDEYARSYVVSGKMCGIISGDENGYFKPADAITRAETAAIIYTMMNTSVSKLSDGESVVETKDGTYTYLYDNYKTENDFLFEAYVPESNAVDNSYFNDAAIIGDSVCLSLQYYCASTMALGNATFLCAGSLSPLNALWDVSESSVHPSYGGVKLKLEDSVRLSGAKKVYIMLGINSLSYGVDKSIESINTLICNILKTNPDVKIVVQSVTPMTANSPIKSNSLNNNTINQYNEKLLQLCEENKWYYLNVAQIFKDANGNLNDAYCSDGSVMGIHFTFSADKIWVDFLKTHVPEALK